MSTEADVAGAQMRALDSMTVTKGRYVVHYGESTLRETAVGTIATLINGAVVFIPKPGVDVVELSDTEADDVWSAFMKAALAAAAVRKQLTGYEILRVSKDGHAFRATHRGTTSAMRLSVLRKVRACRHCGQPAKTMWVSSELPRGHFTEACQGCMEQRSVVPTGLREVKTAG